MTAASEQEHDRTIAECTEKIEAYPDDVHALSLRGWAWYKKKQYDKAIADFDKALCWDPDRVDVLNNRGLAHSGNVEHELVTEDFTEAINRASSDDDLHHFYFNRGRSRRLMRTLEDAIDDFDMAIRIDHQYVRAFRLRGHSWADLGDPDRALADFDRAIQIGSGTADDFHNRGNAWVSLGRFRSAIADFTRSISLESNSTDAATTYNSRGVAWKRKGRYARALADYERALELAPSSAQRHAVLAEFLATCLGARFRDGDRALKLITRASELNGEQTEEYLGCFAAAHAARGDFSSAVDSQKNALELATEQEDIDMMRLYIESYERGSLCLEKPPSWRDRWA
jgi:tetratricopeptide (TPR) repeat protein